jgi:hypothetical protein
MNIVKMKEDQYDRTNQCYQCGELSDRDHEHLTNIGRAICEDMGDDDSVCDQCLFNNAHAYCEAMGMEYQDLAYMDWTY